MVDALDLLQCPVCGTYYEPEFTCTGRVMPHCALPVQHRLSRGQLVEQGAIEADYSAIEVRVVRSLLTDRVVGSPLTGILLDMEV